MSAEPSLFRDVGPYADEQQALRQVGRTTFGVEPGRFRELDAVLGQALLAANVQPSEFEMDRLMQELEDEHGRVDAAALQIMAGWVIRAYVAGTSQPRS